jgi:hypothetical protein
MGTQIWIECECGERIAVPEGVDQEECQCGAMYVVTVTRLSSAKASP